MAEVFGTAASAIAVAESTLRCLKYIKDVKNAEDDIVRIRTEVNHFKAASESVQELLDGPDRERLKASQQLRTTLDDGRQQLEQLQKKLAPSKKHAWIKRLGLRALKWPFESTDIEKVVETLARFTQMISLSLQVDQT